MAYSVLSWIDGKVWDGVSGLVFLALQVRNVALAGCFL
jgi:hypothetical protein